MPRHDTLPAWQELQALAAAPAPIISDCFLSDPSRLTKFSIEAAGLYADYSKQPVTEEIFSKLMTLAEQSKLSDCIHSLFAGENVNYTENRPALHMALRADLQSVYPDSEKNVMPEIASGLAQLARFSESVRSGDWKGATGLPITDVVNLGIGGSDLGPRFLTTALAPYCDAGPRAHFVGNGDGADLHEVLCGLNRSTTLFLVVSKSFTTSETLDNARLAQDWLRTELGDDGLDRHFVGITAKVEKANEFGVAEVLPFWDWVGGRFSVWSAVGATIALSAGMSVFESLLAGARKMDEHFRHAEFGSNLPVIMGMLGIWHTNFLGVNQHVVLPYSHYLERLPAYLQQLEMESNGKSVDRDGRSVSYATVPALWGEVGTNAQHAFMQRLHQGIHNVPVDFVLPLKVRHPYQRQHDALVANCFAQAEALMNGRDANDLQASGIENLEHRVLPGNRPSTMILLPELSPQCLGALLALYEHKVFVQAVIWNINPFDQWGVEEGKRLAQKLLHEIDSGELGQHDASTTALMQRYLGQRNKD